MQAQFRGENLSGRTFGYWRVVTFAGFIQRGKQREAVWLCQCKCGKQAKVRGQQLRERNSKSCGCYAREVASKVNFRHGLSKHPIYRIWMGMNARCNNPSYHSFPDYGGRGIRICKRWHDFALFYEDMIPTWKMGLTLDRKDNEGNYTPANCRWATDKEQCRNTRRSRLLTYRGRTMTMIQWSEQLQMNRHSLSARLNRLGWSVEKALSTPIKTA